MHISRCRWCSALSQLNEFKFFWQNHRFVSRYSHARLVFFFSFHEIRFGGLAAISRWKFMLRMSFSRIFYFNPFDLIRFRCRIFAMAAMGYIDESKGLIYNHVYRYIRFNSSAVLSKLSCIAIIIIIVVKQQQRQHFPMISKNYIRGSNCSGNLPERIFREREREKRMSEPLCSMPSMIMITTLYCHYQRCNEIISPFAFAGEWGGPNAIMIVINGFQLLLLLLLHGNQERGWRASVKRRSWSIHSVALLDEFIWHYVLGTWQSY